MIHTQAQYYAVASRIEQIKDAPTGSEASKELKVLTNLIVRFESGKEKPGWCSSSEQLKTKVHRV